MERTERSNNAEIATGGLKPTIFDPYTDIILVMGKKESGKSHCARKIASTFKRKLIYDYNWEHKGKQLTWWSNYNFPVVCRSLKEVEKAYSEAKNRKDFCIIYHIPDKESKTFNEFCGFVNKNVTYCNIYIEELQSLTTANTIPKEFNTLEANGRHRKCGLLCTFRGTKRIPVRLFDDCDFMFIFKMRRKETYDYLKEYADPDLVDLLAANPADYYFIMVDNHDNTIYMKPLTDLTPKDF